MVFNKDNANISLSKRNDLEIVCCNRTKEFYEKVLAVQKKKNVEETQIPMQCHVSSIPLVDISRTYCSLVLRRCSFRRTPHLC